MTIASETDKLASQRKKFSWLATGVGVAMIAAGAVAVFVSTNEGGSAALLGGGALLIAVGLIGDRIEGIETAGVKVSLRASAARALRAAEKAEADGDLERANALREQADALLDSVRSLSDRYEAVRSTQSKSGGRTYALEQIAAEARKLAYRPDCTPSTTEFLFNSAIPGNRVAALAMMDERPAFVSVPALRDALTGPRSSFEMYTALSAARSYLASGLASSQDSRSLLTIIRSQLERGRLGAANSDRVGIAKRILDVHD